MSLCLKDLSLFSLPLIFLSLCRITWNFSLLSYLLWISSSSSLPLSYFIASRTHFRNRSACMCPWFQKYNVADLRSFIFRTWKLHVNSWLGNSNFSMLIDWEKFPPVSRDPGYRLGSSGCNRLWVLLWLGHSPYMSCLLLWPQEVS